MKVDDKVLVLLPTDRNTLLMQCQWPFVNLEKVGGMDYIISMDGKIKTFHANWLKTYVERSEKKDHTGQSVHVEDGN